MVSPAAPAPAAAPSNGAGGAPTLPTVCVTGASGYIASELCAQLLAKGYTVRGTVRSASDESKVGHLERLAAALPGRLELVEADLLASDGAAWDAACASCDVVFHTASPCILGTAQQLGADPQALLVDPAVRGTRAVLEAAARARVRRVVLTSSAGAVKGLEEVAPPLNGRVYTEEDWNATSSLAHEPYVLSKVLAERAAWGAARELGLDLVTILPQFVMGPAYSPRVATSTGFFKARGRDGLGSRHACLEGGVPDTGSCVPVMVDVRDVARAHILAAEAPAACGRYLVCHSHSTPPAQLTAILQEAFPAWRIQPGAERGGSQEVMDPSRAQRELDLQLRPLRETLVDMARCLVALGVAHPQVKGRA